MVPTRTTAEGRAPTGRRYARGSRTDPRCDEGRRRIRPAVTIASLVILALSPQRLAAQPAAAIPNETPQPAPLAAVTDLAAGDVPSDNGSQLYLSWPRMAFDDSPGVEYVVEQADTAEGPFTEVLRFAANTQYATDLTGPWWTGGKGAATSSDHFVKVPTPVRKSVAVPLKSWPVGVTLPEGLVTAISYNSEAAELRATAALTDDQRELFLEMSHAPDFQAAARALARKARSSQNGGELERPLTKVPFFFRLRAVQGDRQGPASDVVSAVARENWFNLSLLNNLLFVAFMGGALLLFVETAKRRELFLRPIPGLAAVDEAVGRATEMGKSVFYLTGLMEMDKISTIAATIILGEVAKKTAAYGVDLKVPHVRSVTMTVCREITRNAYTEAGRPDAYHDDINYYITDEQFSYAAAVNGQMLRERPGAVFYTGYYYAESLLMAEAGATTGAIQIAATDAEHQLPFFITTCDYTLIGEELYAASAYLSRKPELVGSLRAQDLGKLLIMLLILLGTIFITLAPWLNVSSHWMLDALSTY